MVTIKRARKAGCPLIIVETSDAPATRSAIIAEMNGKAGESAILFHDLGRGLTAGNTRGQNAIDAIFGGADVSTLNPTEVLTGVGANVEALAEHAPVYIFCVNPQLYWANEYAQQAIANLREALKPTASEFIGLVPMGTTIPETIRADVVILNDSLPTREELKTIVNETIAPTGLTPPAAEIDRAVDALTGLSSFAAEQTIAMSLTARGIDFSELWTRKRKTIEQTPGLSVYQGGEKFSDIGGYSAIKEYMIRLMKGKRQPRAIVFIDEIEKALAGASSDTSGTTQDQLGSLLTYMQDHSCAGVIFIGPPGSGKSAIAKAAGNEAAIPTIALDLGGMKSSLVGSSEGRIRAALDVVTAIAGDNGALFIATCNSIGALPPELRRRFTLGTFYFPLPNADDRALIWKVYQQKYTDLDFSQLPDDRGWTGAEIRAACDVADRMGDTPASAARFIVPVSVSAGDTIERLSKSASGKYIDAAQGGIYQHPATTNAQQQPARRINLTEE